MAAGLARRRAVRRQGSHLLASGSTRPRDFTQRLEGLMADLTSDQRSNPLSADERHALAQLIDALSALLDQEFLVENRK